MSSQHALPLKPELFSFEKEEFGALSLIPLVGRYRLDCVGLKLSLKAWQRLPLSERQALLSLPFDQEVEQIHWSHRLLNSPSLTEAEKPQKMELWLDPIDCPQEVLERAQLLGGKITEKNWTALKPWERHALCKLVHSKLGDCYFPAALKEFRLIHSS